jgi:hypothetical protein
VEARGFSRQQLDGDVAARDPIALEPRRACTPDRDGVEAASKDGAFGMSPTEQVMASASLVGPARHRAPKRLKGPERRKTDPHGGRDQVVEHADAIG